MLIQEQLTLVRLLEILDMHDDAEYRLQLLLDNSSQLFWLIAFLNVNVEQIINLDIHDFNLVLLSNGLSNEVHDLVNMLRREDGDTV